MREFYGVFGVGARILDCFSCLFLVINLGVPMTAAQEDEDIIPGISSLEDILERLRGYPGWGGGIGGERDGPARGTGGFS